MLSGMESGKHPRRQIPTDWSVTADLVDDGKTTITSLHSDAEKAGSSVNEFISHFHKLEGRTDSYTVVVAISGAIEHAYSPRVPAPEDLDPKIAVKLSAMVDFVVRLKTQGNRLAVVNDVVKEGGVSYDILRMLEKLPDIPDMSVCSPILNLRLVTPSEVEPGYKKKLAKVVCGVLAGKVGVLLKTRGDVMEVRFPNGNVEEIWRGYIRRYHPF